jgi:hypothetical protein
MTVQEVIAQIPSFSHEERKELLKQLVESLSSELQTGNYQGATTDEVRGIIKPQVELPPDFDWKKIKEEYLVEKYL